MYVCDGSALLLGVCNVSLFLFFTEIILTTTNAQDKNTKQVSQWPVGSVPVCINISANRLTNHQTNSRLN